MIVVLVLVLDRIVIHQPVHSVACLIEHCLGAQATALLQLLEHRHLVLRVEDVELSVGGDESVGELCGVGEAIDPLACVTCADGDHTPCSLVTVECRGRSVGDDGEALDISL